MKPLDTKSVRIVCAFGNRTERSRGRRGNRAPAHGMSGFELDELVYLIRLCFGKKSRTIIFVIFPDIPRMSIGSIGLGDLMGALPLSNHATTNRPSRRG